MLLTDLIRTIIFFIVTINPFSQCMCNVFATTSGVPSPYSRGGGVRNSKFKTENRNFKTYLFWKGGGLTEK